MVRSLTRKMPDTFRIQASHVPELNAHNEDLLVGVFLHHDSIIVCMPEWKELHSTPSQWQYNLLVYWLSWIFQLTFRPGAQLHRPFWIGWPARVRRFAGEGFTFILALTRAYAQLWPMDDCAQEVLCATWVLSNEGPVRGSCPMSVYVMSTDCFNGNGIPWGMLIIYNEIS